MKANEAPEKIILSADRDTQIINDEWVINDYTDNIKIEYTRTDVLIKKTAEWLQGFMEFSSLFEYKVSESEKKKVIEDFVKYMKGE